MNSQYPNAAADRRYRGIYSLLSVAASGCLLLAIAGCGGERYAPVTGVVQLDGEPLADAKLIFEPIGDDTGNAAGKPSYGRTDETGRYSLHCPLEGEEGAAIGRNRVRIVTMQAPTYTDAQKAKARETLQKGEAAGGNPNAEITDEMINNYLSDVVRITQKETLPPRYNMQTELEFNVIAGSDNQADFALTSKP